MHKSNDVFLSIWKGGAYRAASFDASSSCGALVEHDGLGTMRRVGVTDDALEEIVTTRRAVRGGVSIKSSTLRANRDGSVEWLWQVNRPGLLREETWTIDAHGHHAWQQIDRRPNRTTTYRAIEPGRYRGEVTRADGDLLGTSDWKSDGRGGLTGSYSDPQGNPAGSVSYPGRDDRNNGERVTWTGPDSEGSITTSSNESTSSVHHVVKTEGGITTYTTDEGGGYSTQTGSGDGRAWIKITVPGKSVGGAEGDSNWVELGTQIEAGGSSSLYTIGGVSHADGSSSFQRSDNNSTTGEKGQTFGSKDADGNFSYSSSVEHPDGSVTLTTRTVDKNGDGQEQVTVVDRQGTVISDGTNIVKGGVAIPGGGAGAPGDTAGGGPSAPTADSPTEQGQPDAEKPNDQVQPDDSEKPKEADNSDP